MDYQHTLSKFDINYIINTDSGDSERSYQHAGCRLSASTSSSSNRTACDDTISGSLATLTQFDFRISPNSIWKDNCLPGSSSAPLSGLGISFQDDTGFNDFPFAFSRDASTSHVWKPCFDSLRTVSQAESRDFLTPESIVPHRRCAADALVLPPSEECSSRGSAHMANRPIHDPPVTCFESPGLFPARFSDVNIFQERMETYEMAILSDDLLVKGIHPLQQSVSPVERNSQYGTIATSDNFRPEAIPTRMKLEPGDMDVILNNPSQTLSPEQLTQVVDYVFEQIHAQNALKEVLNQGMHNHITPKSDCSPNVKSAFREVLPSEGNLCPTLQVNIHAMLHQRVSHGANHTQRKQANSKTPRILQLTRNLLDSYKSSFPEDVYVANPCRGISEMQVAQKTAHWKATHGGENLSDDFLFTFAGRFEVTGTAIPGYRCYIIGCNKSTKRKDHMADHIRTHLGEKPFKCTVCGLGFIRNNDCQRHQANHLPVKKFVCDCSAAFSRRDLFVRHRKTACALSENSQKRKESSRRQRHGQRAIGPYERDTLFDCSNW